MIAFAPNHRETGRRRTNPAQVDLRFISLLDEIEILRDIQVETPRLKHEAEAIESVIWRQVGALI